MSDMVGNPLFSALFFFFWFCSLGLGLFGLKQVDMVGYREGGTGRRGEGDDWFGAAGAGVDATKSQLTLACM